MNEFFKNNQRQQASKVVNIKEFLSSKGKNNDSSSKEALISLDGHKHSVSVNPSVNMINAFSMKQNCLDKTDVDIKEANGSDSHINVSDYINKSKNIAAETADKFTKRRGRCKETGRQEVKAYR